MRGTKRRISTKRRRVKTCNKRRVKTCNKRRHPKNCKCNRCCSRRHLMKGG
jgi:hypothetical protein